MFIPEQQECKNSHRFVIVTGLSGAGKTLAIHSLEDMGYYCVDNIPQELIPAVARHCNEHGIEQVAVISDIRSGADFSANLSPIAGELCKLCFLPTLIFLEASEETLIRRFKETRRRHPLSTTECPLPEAIRLERQQLNELRAYADKIIDTSDTSTLAFKQQMAALFSPGESRGSILVDIFSFGHKHGTPMDADLLFDVRFLHNPFYVAELQTLTGEDQRVVDYVMTDPGAPELLGKLNDLLQFSLPRYDYEGKSYLTVGVGCTGGKHRSVVFARLLADFVRSLGYDVVLEHRDISK